MIGKNSRRTLTLVVLSAAMLFCAGSVQGAETSSVDAAALARTRRLVRMLDDIYKSSVVLITEHYVTEESDLPAGTAAKALFQIIKDKGWHEVRLLDAAGEPLNEENVAADDFEKEAIRRLRKGEQYFDQVVMLRGKPHLRAATIVPVVMKKCTMCHPNYEAASEGSAIGALAYTVPIE